MKYLLLLLILTGNIFSLQAQTSDEFYEMALKKVEKKQYLDANTLIDKAIDRKKGDYRYYLVKADIEFQLNNHVAVIQSLYNAIGADPKNSETYSQAGMYYSSFGIPDSAVAMYNRAIAYAENDTVLYSMYMNRATAYMHNQDFKSARKDLERSLAFNPDNVGTLNNMAITLDGLKKTKESIVFLKKTALLDSSFAGTFINLGLYYTELGIYPDALANFDYALSLAPDEPLLYSNRGHLYYKMGEYTRAIKDLNRSIEGYPTNPYVYRNRALVYLAMKKPGEACRDLEAALHYGYTQFYGDEVKKLAKKNCK